MKCTTYSFSLQKYPVNSPLYFCPLQVDWDIDAQDNFGRHTLKIDWNNPKMAAKIYSIP